jgi:hypothetical protein
MDLKATPSADAQMARPEPPEEQDAATPAPPDAAPPPSAPGKGKDGDNVMVFQVGLGELPNVVQYLNFSRRTGKLEVDSKQMLAERGVVCFRDGEVYYARFGHLRGIDAMVEMVQFKTAEAVFIGGESVNATNVEMSARDLVIQVAVAADQKQNEQAAAEQDEEFIVPTSGSRIVLRDVSPVETAPAASGETGSRLTVVMVILAAVAVIVNTIWVVSELREAGSRRQEARQEAGAEEARIEAERQKQRKVNQMLQAAVEAYKSNRLEEGAEGVAAVLAVDPGNDAALTLQKRIADARNLVELVPLRAEAELREQKLEELLRTKPFQQEAEAARTALRSAEVLFGHK